MGGASSLESLDIEGLTDASLTNRENATLGVAYGENEVTQGCNFTPTQSATAPAVKWTLEGNDDKKYTLICTDPDAPDREGHAYREFIHWVRSDISGASLASGTIDGTDNLPYVGPGPPYNSGDHRYIFLLFEQPAEGYNLESLVAAFEGRGGKKAAVAAKAAGLGDIVAISVFISSWDESVDALHESLGFLPPPEFRSPKQQAANPPAEAAAATDAAAAPPAEEEPPAAAGDA